MNKAIDKVTSEIWRQENDPPPFLGQWKRLYLLVLFYLFTLIVALYAITRIFRY